MPFPLGDTAEPYAPGMTTELSHSRTFPVPVERAYDQVLTTPLPQLFSRRYAVLPPIREVRDQHGEWGSDLGQSRTIVLADGGTMQETLTRIDRPDAFGYTIGAITGPMRPLVGSASGLWSFAPAGTGTRITWSWSVEPANAVGAAFMPVFSKLWQGFARQGMEQLEAVLI